MTVPHARLLGGARWLLARRWLADNAFSVLFMAPLVIGGAAAIFQPYAAAIAGVLRTHASLPVGRTADAALALTFVFVLVARFSGAVRDVFAVAPSEFYVDGLPVSESARLHDVLLVRFSKGLPLAAAGSLVVALAAPEGVSLASAAVAALPVALIAVAVLALVDTAFALVAVRMGLVRPARLAAVTIVLAVLAVVASVQLTVAAIVVAVGSYLVARTAFTAWRVEDRERAREALAVARRSSPRFEQFADRLFTARVGAQVVRDLRLVRRGFSSTPYVAVGAAAVAPALGAWLVPRYQLSPMAAARAIETATVIGVFALAAVTHSLVAYERSRVWIDLSSGIEPDEFPKAKMWTARLLALPSVGFALAAMTWVGAPFSVAELLELGWLWWSTASLAAVFCYEMADRPAAGLVLAFIAAAGDALLVVFYTPGEIMWYFGPFLYVYVVSNMLPRAGLKASARC